MGAIVCSLALELALSPLRSHRKAYEKSAGKKNGGKGPPKKSIGGYFRVGPHTKKSKVQSLFLKRRCLCLINWYEGEEVDYKVSYRLQKVWLYKRKRNEREESTVGILYVVSVVCVCVG